MKSIGATTKLHPDFGTSWDGAPIGIPFVTVTNATAKVPVTFRYKSESDKGPYPIPKTAPIEGGSKSTGDRHVIVVDPARRLAYRVTRTGLELSPSGEISVPGTPIRVVLSEMFAELERV